jgi:integrase
MRRRRKRSNGEGTVYPRSDGRWGATILLADGSRRTVYALTERDALEKMRKLMRVRDQGIPVTTSTQRTGEYLERWLEDTARPSVRPKTYDSYRVNVQRLLPLIGSIQLGNLSPAHVQNAYAALHRRGLSPRSIHHAHTVLHGAMRKAQQWGLIPRNPTEGAARPRMERREMRTLSQADLQRLFEATEDEYPHHALWVLLATTGLRLGEALGLRWEDVDLARGLLTVKRALQRQTGRGLVFVEPKSSSSRRSVHLAPGTVACLARHHVRQKEATLEAGGAAQDPELVFSRADGLPLDASAITRRFDRTLARACLPDVRVHDLRHTAASLLLLRGVHPKVVQEMLGHSSVALTLDTYSHLAPSLHAEVASKMEALFAALR